MSSSVAMKSVDTKALFGFDVDFDVQGFVDRDEFVPEVQEDYYFDPATTRVILAGLSHNLRVLIQGYHGTGKSTHIEQVAARLNWPCYRLNLDGHLSRLDLIGRDAIVLENGKQVTTFKEGILPWATQRPMLLVLDEYDAGRPEVMFIIQRLLEQDGALALPDQNKVLHPHTAFRLMGTSNTVGLGDGTGLYHGTHTLNQAQMDRWSIVSHLNYLEDEIEVKIVLSHVPRFHNQTDLISRMVQVASLTRTGFSAGDISTVMSPRTVISWAKNSDILGDVYEAYKLSFVNRADVEDMATLDEYYDRVLGDIQLLD